MSLVLLAAAFFTSAGVEAATVPEPCKNHYILNYPCEPAGIDGWRWSSAGDMNAPRAMHAATLLADGRVLVTGGLTAATTDQVTRSAEIFDPATGTWTPTAPMTGARYLHSATLLGNGQVMVTGGLPASGTTATPDFAELYDPQTQTWRSVELGEYRVEHAVTLLRDGTLMISGGHALRSTAALDSTVFYDFRSGHSRYGPRLAHARGAHRAVALQTGSVVVLGGDCDAYIRPVISDVEVYEPHLDRWRGAPDLDFPRDGATADLLPDGRVILAGGFGYDPREETTQRPFCPGSRVNEDAFGPPAVYATVHLFEPVAGWTRGTPMVRARQMHSATALASGIVLVVGGLDSRQPLASAETRDPSTGVWREISPLAQGRFTHTATQLRDGRVLVTGGFALAPASGQELALPACIVCTGAVARRPLSSAEVIGPPR